MRPSILRLSLRAFLAFALIGVVSSSAQAYALYATGHLGPSGISTFYRLVPSLVEIGEIGFNRVGAIDSHPFTQVIYGCGQRESDGTPVLITIDPLSGAGTEVGPTGIGGAISDIAFRPSDGKLFAHFATAGSHALYTIDIQTGAATLVGMTGLIGGGNALEFGPDGRLWLYTESKLYQLNQATGQSLGDDDLVYSPQSQIAAADLGFGSYMWLVIKTFPTAHLAIVFPSEVFINYQVDLGNVEIDGLCFASRPFGYATSGQGTIASDLFRIDLTTGETSLIGPIGFNQVGGIDFAVTPIAHIPALHATGVDPVSGAPVLLTIDLATGKGTSIGPTGLAYTQVADIATLEASSRLMAWQPINDPDQSVFSLNFRTGASSLIGNTGISFQAGNGIAELPTTATIYHASHTSLHTINSANGVATLVAPLTYLPPLNVLGARPPAMDFSSNGSLYALCRAPSVSLARIDVLASTIGSIGDTGHPQLEALAVRNDPAPLQLVLAPNGGENYPPGSTQPITWDPFDDVTTPRVELAYTTGVELYAATSEVNSSLYKIDLTTGAATYVGAIGYGNVGGMVSHPVTGELIGTADFGGTRELIRIDPQTGYSLIHGPTETGRIGDIAWRTSDNTLFAFNVENAPTHTLHRLNYQIGKATLVGSTGLAGAGGNALEFVGNTLYHSNVSNLHTLDTSTGTATVVAPMSWQVPFISGDARLAAMKRHPGTGVMYCLIKGGAPGSTAWLGRLDVATGIVTNIGDTGVPTLDAIAFAPGPYTVISASEFNDGSYSWTVPNTSTTLARVRVRGGDQIWGVGEDISNQVFSIQGVVGADPGSSLSLLGAVSPNPSRGSTSIQYSISRRSTVRLTVHDVRGRLVSSLVDGVVDAGPRAAAWDGRNAGGAVEPSGVYLIRFEVDGQVQTSRFTMIR